MHASEVNFIERYIEYFCLKQKVQKLSVWKFLSKVYRVELIKLKYIEPQYQCITNYHREVQKNLQVKSFINFQGFLHIH